MSLQTYQKEFFDFVIATQALRFGQFVLKSGRISPYFFNTGLFSTGERIARLGQYYAAAIVASKQPFDMLFGPAYKGIPLVVATSIALAEKHGRDVPFAFNRKEVKDHGEGGIIVGSALAGRVLILDDVISSGLSIGESIQTITSAGAEPAGVVIAMDRQEKGRTDRSAVQDVVQQHGVPVTAVANVTQLSLYLESSPEHAQTVAQMKEYRRQYGCE